LWPFGQVPFANPLIILMPSKRTPPPFLRGNKISNEFYTRHDAINLAEDSLVLNVVFPEIDAYEPVLVAKKWIKDKSKNQNDHAMGND